MSHRFPLLLLLALLLLAPLAVTAAPPQPTGVQAPGQWLHVIKSPDPLYVVRGGPAQFTIVVLNTSDVFAMTGVTVSDALTPDCALTIGALAPAAEFSYTCSLPAVQAAFTNTVEVTGVNATNGKLDTATDTAVVEIAELTIDLDPVPATLPEPGGTVAFSLLVRNTGSTGAALTGLTSPQFGDLTSEANPLLQDNTCAGIALPQLFPGGTPLTCSFSAAISAPPGPYAVTVNATAVAGGVFSFQGAGQATIPITDSPSELQATLTAARDRVPLGGLVELDVNLTNASVVDAITVVNMSDSELGDVTSSGTCAVPQTLGPGEQYACRYRLPAAGPVGQSINYVFTASGVNDDQPPGQVSAQAGQSIFVFQPLVFMPTLTNPLNLSCATAFLLQLDTEYEFTPARQDAWYYFTLSETADIIAEITNYVPRFGQMIIYSATGPTCQGLVIEGNDGGFTDVKRVELPDSPPNRYYLRVFTDGALNEEVPYTLTVRAR